MRAFNARQPNSQEPCNAGWSYIIQAHPCKLCKTQHFLEFNLHPFKGRNVLFLEKWQKTKKLFIFANYPNFFAWIMKFSFQSRPILDFFFKTLFSLVEKQLTKIVYFILKID